MWHCDSNKVAESALAFMVSMLYCIEIGKSLTAPDLSSPDAQPHHQFITYRRSSSNSYNFMIIRCHHHLVITIIIITQLRHHKTPMAAAMAKRRQNLQAVEFIVWQKCAAI